MSRTPIRSTNRSARRRWSAATLILVACAGAFAAGARTHADRHVIGVSGGDQMVYRVYDNGDVEYIIYEKDRLAARGVIDWAPLRIDHRLTRDELGNPVGK